MDPCDPAPAQLALAAAAAAPAQAAAAPVREKKRKNGEKKKPATSQEAGWERSAARSMVKPTRQGAKKAMT